MQIWLQELCQSSHGFGKGASAPREEKSNTENTQNAPSPPQVPCFKHGVLVTVQGAQLDVLVVAREQPVLLPLGLLQPEMSFGLVSGALGPGAEGQGEHSE